MSKAITVNVKHSLGAETARTRIETGISQFRASLGARLTVFEEIWTKNHLDFKVGFRGQVVEETLDVFESQVRLEIHLPGLLGFFAEKLQSLVRKKGQLLLGHDKQVG